MSENPVQPLHAYAEPASGLLLLLAFLLRLWKASGTFLNLDEAMHFLAANKPSLAEAYYASFNLAHPPLLILLLNVWRKMGTSELVLRLPSVIAGTIFCWIFFKWLTRLLGPATGWAGLILVSFLPPFVELSSEIRQYPILLCFLIAAAYILELALAESSAGRMSFFFFFLYLAMLTHYSAILLAGAVGVYSLSRLLSSRLSRTLVTIWIAGQAGAAGLFAWLYRTRIAGLKSSSQAQHMQALLANSYFHPGHDHLLTFVFARSFGVFQYTFGQLAVGDVASLLFLGAAAWLLCGKEVTNSSVPSPRQLGLLLVLPFAITCAAAIAGQYPFGGTRHSAFLIPFAVAGVSQALARLARQRLAYAVATAMVVVAACHLFGAPHRPYMRRDDQRRANMTRAIDTLREQAGAGSTIFVDFQTNFLLRFYLCPDAGSGAFAASGFKEYSCAGYRVIAMNSETTVLTADTFTRRWNEMVDTYDVKPGQTFWIFQAGWDISLARDLQEKFPEFHGLKSESFGRNISLFKLTTGCGNIHGCPGTI